VEIFHPWQRRHRPRAVRDDPRLHGGATGDRRRCRRHGVDDADQERQQLQPRTSERRIRLSAARLWHQGRAGAAARLAARRACEGPTPISAVLSGLLLNVALYALLRFKMLLAVNLSALASGPLMVTLGLVSLVFAAFMLYRRRDIKRMFAYSSIEHMGIIVFAFGMGGPIANFAGLLHMAMHSLTKSAIFFAVGHIAQTKGTQKIAEMGGLTETNPVLGWGLVLGVVAIAGLPPLGIFMSEFLIVSFHLRPPAAARYRASCRLAHWLRCLVPTVEQHRFRRAAWRERRSKGILCADVHPFGAGVYGWNLPASANCHVVPECRKASRIGPC